MTLTTGHGTAPAGNGVTHITPRRTRSGRRGVGTLTQPDRAQRQETRP